MIMQDFKHQPAPRDPFRLAYVCGPIVIVAVVLAILFLGGQ